MRNKKRKIRVNGIKKAEAKATFFFGKNNNYKKITSPPW
jgi:hypothetical protein